MSLEFNADKQRISSSQPIIVGTEEFTIRAGVGSDEKEVLRVQLDPDTQLPRVGINRTGRKVEKITIDAVGNGYTVTPSVILSAPDDPINGVQATASANINAGAVTSIVVTNPGFGYFTAPSVTISGGNGIGAQATAVLDEVAYELDVNGAIRTSTSIISDTARILNLDIDNFVTADAKFRAPNLKIYQNATGTQWSANTTLQKDDFVYLAQNIYRALNTGTTGTTGPFFTDGEQLNGEVLLKHEGYREDSPLLPYYGQTGDGLFPRSVTPLLGDKSTKIATTEYVLNLATNDVGGRVYVSEQIGNDENDGRSAAAPVRSVKRACQIASQSVGVKESIIIAGGNYEEDNPISIPPDCSIIGDNLRLVIIRPRNARKHMFKFGDKNYINGITFRDKIDSFGDSEFTWDYAVTFDDKQRIYYDANAGGDYERDFPIGHQIFGPPRIRVTFGSNTAAAEPLVGTIVQGENTGARGEILAVSFEDTTSPSAYDDGYVDINVLEGSFNLGETFNYYSSTSYTPTNVTYDPASGLAVFTIANHGFAQNDQILISAESLVFTCALDNNSSQHAYPRASAATGQPDFAYKRWLSITAVTTNTFTVNVGPSSDTSAHTFVSALPNAISHAAVPADEQSFVSIDLISIRAEGEITSVGEDITSTLPIVFVDGSQIADPDIGGVIFYTNTLTGGEANTRQNIHNFKEGEEIFITGMPTTTPDLSMFNGKQRIYKVIYDADGRSRRFVIPKDTSSTFNSTFTPQNATVNSFSKYITVTLLNSPNKFSEQFYVARRFQDACNLLRNNTDFIADEVVKQINDEFAQKYLSVNNVTGSSFDVYTQPNSFTHTYVSGGTVTYGGNVYNVSNFVYNNATGVGTITTSAAITGLNAGDTVKVENILVSCSQGEKLYPGFNIPNGDAKCLRDVKHFINAIIMDLEYGGNYNIVEAAERYVVGTQIGYIGNEITESLKAYERARELCILAMRNWRIGSGLYTEDIFTPRYSTLQRYFDPTVTEDTTGGQAGATCSDVASAIDTLGYLFTDIISNNANARYQDASYLIARNIDLIAEEALALTENQYPSLSLNYPDKTKCKRDIKYVLRGLRRDLTLGGNQGITTAGFSYFSGGQLVGIPQSELAPTRYAFTQARDLAIKAIRNWSDGTVARVTPSNAAYTASSGALTLTVPSSQIPQTFGSAPYFRVAFRENALTYSCTHDGQTGNYSSPKQGDANFGQSFAVLNYTNNGTTATIELNVGDAGAASSAPHTFVSALANATILVFDHQAYLLNSGIPVFEDWDITPDSSNPTCADVASAITTSFQTLDDILDGQAVTTTQGTLYTVNPTYPVNAFVYDADNKYITPRAVWDDLPYIDASPYIQNSSIISFLGGNGCEIDGNKIAQPNCPYPGIEENGSASNPNQGKSMVASAFTIVSFGGTGYKVINDGYTQLVSVFVIFCQDGIFCDTGGYASVTNSATNFGTYALRARGYREEAYPFDVGQITGVGAATGTGFTTLTVQLLGREPLEHYIAKIDGYESENPNVDYFIDSVGIVSSGPPFTAEFTLNDAASFRDKATGSVVTTDLATFNGATIRLHRPSIVNSSSHTWEFAGAGTDYNALPENGGTKVEANEQVSESYGRVYTSGTDELGDFKVGYFAKIENRTGAITFTGTVTISEVEFLKLKGGDVVVTGFSDDNTLGGNTSSNGVLPTQKAVKDYITNNLGPYINKPYSTNPVPRALVELTDSGKISVDQIPALRPFSVYTVANQAARTSLEGALAGDIAIQQDTSTSYILNNDTDSLFCAFAVNPALNFGAIGGIFTGSITTGQIQSTEYRQGVVYQINITNPGSGYLSTPTVSITSPSSGIQAAATCTIANGQVVTVTIITSGGYKGGYGYATPPTVTFSAAPGGGTTATATALIESRLYGDIVNNIKIEDTDELEDVNSVVVNLSRVVNTSAFDNNNWVSLSSNQIAASDITSGVISTARLALDSDAANSFTFLRGDQTYAPTVQTIKGVETRYFEKTYLSATNGTNLLTFPTASSANILIGHTLSTVNGGISPNTSVSAITARTGYIEIELNNPITQNIGAGTYIQFGRPDSPIILGTDNTATNYIDSIVIVNGGLGYTANADLRNIPLQGGNSGSSGLTANITTDSNGTISTIVVTNGGGGYTADFLINPIPAQLGNPTNAATLSAKRNTAIKGYANVSIDVFRVTENTTSGDAYGTVGVSKFKKSQFNIGLAGDGSVELKTGSTSGLDADLLDGQQGAFYQSATNLVSGTLNKLRLSGSYDIDISGQSGNTLRLKSQTTNPTSSPAPSTFSEGAVINLINNTANSLSDGGSQNAVLTIRGKGSGTTADGGVRQLAFTDNNNIYFRGSGTGVTTWSNWYKVWTEFSDGPGTGLDADKLDNKQGKWFQDARNLNFYEISDTRISSFLTAKSFQNTVAIRQVTNKPYYDIYVSGSALTTSPFLNGQTVNLYDANAQGVGTIVITNVNPFTDPSGDTSLNWTVIRGFLDTGTFNTAETIGTASIRVGFQEFWLVSDGTYQVAQLDSDGGTAKLNLGRKDGTASSPGIFFNSSSAAASYNSSIVASGGGSAAGSGSLNVTVANANSFTINNQTIWNAGNITFATNNVGNTAVLRDASGNFSAGTISASLTGAASANVLRIGDTMTGTLTINNTTSDNQIAIAASNKFFTFAGGLQFRGDGSSWNARFSTTNTGGTEILGVYSANFGTAILRVDNNRRTIFDMPANRSDAIIINGQAGGYSSIIHQNGGTTVGYRMAYCQTAGNYGSGTAVGDIVERIDGNRNWHFKTNSGTTALVMDASQNVAINQSSTNTSYKLYVNGSFGATSKSFVIPHPTKENHELRYGSLEGPEHGVYVRGKSDSIIELPEYWTALVDEDSITVQLTPIGDHHAWVEKIEDNKIFIGGGESFYFVQGTRKDIDPLEVEVELPVVEEEE